MRPQTSTPIFVPSLIFLFSTNALPDKYTNRKKPYRHAVKSSYHRTTCLWSTTQTVIGSFIGIA